eukprot:gene3170-1579_t
MPLVRRLDYEFPHLAAQGAARVDHARPPLRLLADDLLVAPIDPYHAADPSVKIN